MTVDWKEERYITHRSFRIVDLVGEDDLIMGRTFEDCTIYGPAVLAPLQGVSFEHDTFEGDPKALFWEIPEGRVHVLGAIGLVNCTFHRCKFRGIGFAGTPALIQRFLQVIHQ